MNSVDKTKLLEAWHKLWESFDMTVAVLRKVNEFDERIRKGEFDTKLCDTTCRWYEGKHTMTGIGSDWPCQSCGESKYEPLPNKE